MNIWPQCTFVILEWERTPLLHCLKNGPHKLPASLQLALTYHKLQNVILLLEIDVWGVNTIWKKNNCVKKVVRSAYTLDEQVWQCHYDLEPQRYPPIYNHRYQDTTSFAICKWVTLNKSYKGKQVAIVTGDWCVAWLTSIASHFILQMAWDRQQSGAPSDLKWERMAQTEMPSKQILQVEWQSRANSICDSYFLLFNTMDPPCENPVAKDPP